MTWMIKPYIKGLNERDTQTVLFAAQELKRYLSLATDESVLLSEDPDLTDHGLILGVALSENLPDVEDVKQDDYLNFILFSGDVTTWKDRLVPATPENIQEARKFVMDIHDRGSKNRGGSYILPFLSA